MRNLFFALYGSGIEWNIYCLAMLLVGFVLLIVAIKKFKKSAKIISIIVSVLLMWQIIPCAFCLKSDIAQYNSQYDKGIKYMEMAVNTAVIPWQKGIYYSKLADCYFVLKQGKLIIENFDKAYKYIKSYSIYKPFGYHSMLAYNAAGDYETYLKILKELKLYRFLAIYEVILNNDYKAALEYANLAVESGSQSVYDYATRASINYKLNNKSEEHKDYQKALELAKNQAESNYVKGYKAIIDKEVLRQKFAAKEMGFLGE